MRDAEFEERTEDKEIENIIENVVLSTHFKREMIIIVGADLQFPIRIHCTIQDLSCLWVGQS